MIMQDMGGRMKKIFKWYLLEEEDIKNIIGRGNKHEARLQRLEKRPEIIRCKNCKHNNNCEIQYAAQAGCEFLRCGRNRKRERMMEVKINLNEKVKFKLSERGKEIYRHRYDGYGFEYNREPELDDNGYMEMQLWMFMQIFGEHMIMGISEVLDPLEIIYESESK